MMSTQAAARQGDTLDALCHRALGTTAGTVEAALELNRGLADIGPTLPEGYLITLPERPAEIPAARINLWD